MRQRIDAIRRRIGRLPCAECEANRRPIEWYEVDADCEDEAAEDGPRPVCPRCGRPLAVSFIEVVLPARQDT